MNNRPITLGNFFGFYILSFVFLLFWRNADSLATAKNKDVVNIQSNFY